MTTSQKITHYSKAIVAFLTFLATLLTTVVGVAAFAIPAAYVGAITSVIAGITVIAVFLTKNTPNVTAVVDDFTGNAGPKLENALDGVKGAQE